MFLGSGLLFVAMYWSGVAQLASLVADNRLKGAPPLSAETLEHARAASFSFMFVLAARAAAVFVFATSTSSGAPAPFRGGWRLSGLRSAS